jgi:hypothetical protein
MPLKRFKQLVKQHNFFAAPCPQKTPTNSQPVHEPQPKPTQMTTTTTTTAADSYPSSLDDGARIYELRRAMCAWRADPVNRRTRLVKDIAREYAASDREITRAFLRVSGGFFPSPLAYKDLDAYVAAWRDAIVNALRAYRATSDRRLLSVVLDHKLTAAATRRAFSGGMAERPPRSTPRRVRTARGGATPSAWSATGRGRSEVRRFWSLNLD